MRYSPARTATPTPPRKRISTPTAYRSAATSPSVPTNSPSAMTRATAPMFLLLICPVHLWGSVAGKGLLVEGHRRRRRGRGVAEGRAAVRAGPAVVEEVVAFRGGGRLVVLVRGGLVAVGAALRGIGAVRALAAAPVCVLGEFDA